MSEESADLAARLRAIRGEIAAACARSGREVSSVTLLGASKTQPASALLAAYEAGLTTFGENRVQEARAKAAELPSAVCQGISWHLIGPLQSNKVKQALELFTVFHAVDRPEIAVALDRAAAACGRQIAGFLEVNLGSEASKHGFAPESLTATVAPLAGLAHLRIAGLMAIPPQTEEPEASRPWFQRLRELRDELAATPPWRGFPGWLSMGMSDDFPVAIEEGATHVRVGTALFGPRRNRA
ncbi:MAG TPA: YggS family pyridoxal phosphate-dependent enzyme [Thermoanaerobaculia bacterium]|nr:YggS family pyridoxal phosphate-dependent enzyme [Thermoanaerobaculia bacterium]